MTAKNGKPKDGVNSASAAPPDEAADNESAPMAMQTDQDNGVASVNNNAAPNSTIVGQDIQNYLGRKLKASYDDLVRQPVPDKFRQLLEELERREKEK
jgi:hypothetical protein